MQNDECFIQRNFLRRPPPGHPEQPRTTAVQNLRTIFRTRGVTQTEVITILIPTYELTDDEKKTLRQRFAEMLEEDGEILIEVNRYDRSTTSGALAVELITRLELRSHKPIVERNAED
ncbi:hypothetical protein D9Y32_17705 [Bacillus licheniformis]|nr:hypothetical protein D9Y32_17705 [Bacillus licheniformis]